MTQAAFTPPGHMPPYINASRQDDGSVIVTVRAAAGPGVTPAHASITIPAADWVDFTEDALRI